MVRTALWSGLLGSVALWPALAGAQTPQPASRPAAVLFENVRVFDGTSEQLTPPRNVLVVGNKIQTISEASIAPPAGAELTRIAGNGRTLMPGLIDAHTHLSFTIIPQAAALTADIGFVHAASTQAASGMLMRGFTTARDAGGPVFGLKRAIDEGVIPGPRIWPSGAFISQTGGHADFRLPTEMPARPGDMSYGERTNMAMIVDGVDAVRKRVREQLALGASQIKLHAGGGVSSSYDPLDVTQFSPEEMRAAVNAAENWGTYVMVHAYTPRAVRQAIEAGVRVVEHGQLIDEPTAQLMAEKGVWISLQPFLQDEDMIPFPEGSGARAKQLEMIAGTEKAYALAKKYKLKTAWSTDTLFDARLATHQGAQLAKLTRWYTPAQALRMATGDNGELLALSGLRSPYAGKLGVVQQGALADLLLVDGDPIANIKLIEDPVRNLVVIMKDGKIYKNTLP
ncbi:MAG: amidohydrolase family protein [Burkholderiales bacterium]|nr:amidohydrolase family protein [Burkholderiales bacterium]